MKQKFGYAVMQKPESLFQSYEISEFAQSNSDVLKRLRSVFSFVTPHNYRGISRDPVQPWDSANERPGWETRNKQARIQFREIIGTRNILADYNDEYDEDLFPDVDVASEIHKLLDSPNDYEIVTLSKNSVTHDSTCLGYDIGYWGCDHFSLICDCAVMPRWHPPDLEDLGEVAERLKSLNNNVLFKNRIDAKMFLEYYKSKSWAETEDKPGEFRIIQVGIPERRKGI